MKPRTASAKGFPDCKRGHNDWYVDPLGRRRCRACKNMGDTRYKTRATGYGGTGLWSSSRDRSRGSGKIEYDTMTRTELLKARGYDN